MSFGAPEGGKDRVREDIRDPIRPLPPANPYYPLVLLVGSGVLLAGVLVGTVVYFTSHGRPPNPLLEEGVRAKRSREEEPIISIREIPVLPPMPPSTPIQVDPSKVPPLIPEPLAGTAGALAKAQQHSVRANLSGLVYTILALTGRLEDAHEVFVELGQEDDEIRDLLKPLSDRPEVRSFNDYFKQGDELTGFGNLALDPLHPLLFADAVRTWLSEAQGGALAIATLVRDGRTRTLIMWFPEFSVDLIQRIRSSPKKAPQ